MSVVDDKLDINFLMSLSREELLKMCLDNLLDEIHKLFVMEIWCGKK